MSFLGYKHLLLSYLLIHFTFTNQLMEPQTLIPPDPLQPFGIVAPNFDALQPFGLVTGSFINSCPSPKSAAGATFTVLNNCSFTVWAAIRPGGGKRLDSSQAWILNVPSGTTGGRVWGRTNCTFDSSGRGRCETGDCGGVLQCQTYGSPPNTLAEFALDQFNDLDFFDISLVDGFNIPMELRPTSNGCSRGVRCAADINGQCPMALRAPGGCHNPCTVFQTDEYCCTNVSGSCGPTNFSKYFRDRCPNAYSYPLDDQNSTFTCPAAGRTNYDVVFCPS